LKFLACDYRVLLCELLLLLRQVVEGAVVGLSVAVLGAVHVGALARVFHESNFLVALPALVNVGLKL
jgi:hypothetical protein